MGRFLFFIFFICLLVFISCTNSETGKSKPVHPDEIFFDYKIKGDEKDSHVTVYIQYRTGGPNGATLALEDPASVQLDGEAIPLDSARLTGAFYEIQKPAKGFTGKHTILFTNLDRKEYREEFIYQPFKLRTNIPAIVDRGDLAFDFDGLEDEDYMRVSLVDTSFRNRDINEIDTIENGKLIIPARKLRNLVDGPITVLFYKDIEKPVKNGTRAGGRISVTYGMQREFELRGPLPTSREEEAQLRTK